jgi:hypothetical protein
MYFRSVSEIHAWESPWPELPEHIRQNFSKLEHSAYTGGPAFFKDAAERLGEPSLVALFRRLEDDQPMRVYIESENDGRPFIWYSFVFDLNLVHQPQFRVATTFSLPIRVPPRLQKLYSTYGGFRYNSEDCGGLVPPEKVRRLSDIGGGQLKAKLGRASEYYWVLSYGNGDYVCVNSAGQCATYDHEQSEMGKHELDAALDGFLDGMLDEQDLEKLFGNG